MFKKLLVAASVVAALIVGSKAANTASADWRHDCHWHRGPYLAGPPIILGGYYPARYYYGYPIYYGPYGYRTIYGSGVRVSVDW